MPPAQWGGLDSLWGDIPTPEESGKEMPNAVKAEEEIQKFMVDEHLSEVERTVLYLNGGQLIQQRHAIVNLPSVIRGRGRPAFDAIAQHLKAALNRLDAEAQIATAEAFATIARERFLSPADLQACILPMVVRNINKEKSEEETDAWLSTLFDLIPLLDKEVLKNDVLSLALSKGDVEGSVSSRTICVRVLGALAPRLSWEEIDRSFFKKALGLCQDVDHHIRISTCNQLGAIARIAGKDVTAKTVLPEVVELLNDESIEARMAAFNTLAAILDILPPEVRKGQVMPILRNHMQPLELDILMQRGVAKVFGQIVAVVKADFEQDDSMTFFGCFRHLAAKNDVELRRLCAGQLPMVLKAAAALSANAFQQQFQDTVNSLVNDPDLEVRKALATQFHEIARIVGKDCPALLTRAMCRLLRDESHAVQAAMLPMFTATLQHWQIRDEPKREVAMAEVAKALMDLEGGTKRNWRLQQQLAAVFPALPQVFSSDQIFDHFLPIAWRYLSSTAATVRPAAADGVACFLRYNRKDKQRAELFLRIVRDLCRGKSFSQRIAFADLAQHLVRRFSSRWIKEYVFDLCLELLYDPVPNVRLVASAVLPGLKQCIRLPEDVDLLERLNSAMSNSMTDNDRDVSQNARALNDQYKKTPMRMGGPGGMLDMGGAGGGSVLNTEAEDARKEDEEADFTFAVEDLKEIKAEILQVGVGKKGPLAGRSVNKGRVGGLGGIGAQDRSSAPALGARAGFGAAAAAPSRKLGQNSDDGSGRSSPAGQLNTLRPPPGMSAARPGLAGGGGAAGAKGYGGGSGTAAAAACAKPPLTGPSRIATTSSNGGKPGSPSPGGPPMTGSPTAAGLKLPAITVRTPPNVGSPLASSPTGAKSGTPTRLNGSMGGPGGATAKAIITTTGSTIARKGSTGR